MLKVFICEDNIEYRENLVRILPRLGEFFITGESDTAEKAFDNNVMLESDLLILDLEMPGKGGHWLIQKLQDESVKPEILVLTSFTCEENVFKALKDGAAGYLVKGAPLKKIVAALQDISSGGSVIEPALAARFWNLFVSCSGVEDEKPDLSESELEVLTLVAKGLSNPEVGSALGKSRTNVKKILSRIFRKMNVKTRVEAVTMALRKGMISI
ncbi:MAG: response regulator transcription factor [Deltaproteobacteria bacterium]|nr:response regulator transcription factor [Deltaproteobacteria bacterium]